MSKADLYHLIDTLPEDVVRRIDDGGPVTLVVTRERGQFEMREVDPEQAWYWTPEWQAGEREVDAEIAAGLGTIYYSDEEFLQHLNSVRPART